MTAPRPTISSADLALQVLREAFAPRRELSVWKWAEENVVLSSRVTKRPGPYSTSFCAWVREPQENFTDPYVHTIILCFATRMMKTEILLNMVRYTIKEDPKPVLFVDPNAADARMNSEIRFRPTVEDSPALATEIPENSDLYKLAEMHFRRCTVWFTGASSPAKLKGKQVSILLCNEIDTWPHQSKKETGALEQVKERTKDSPDRKHVFASTPTVDSGQIWVEFEQSDKRYYFVPCPHCGHKQRLILSDKKGTFQLRWQDSARNEDGTWDIEKVKADTWYDCEKCHQEIRDQHKPDMLARGEWRPTCAAKEPGRIGYHISSLYPEWIKFGEVAARFLLAKGNAEALQAFVNSWLAEPFHVWGNQDEAAAALEASKLRESPKGVPDGYKALLAVDVQHTDIVYRVRAFNPDRDSIGLDEGRLAGFPEAEEIRKKWNCPYAFVDKGYAERLHEVLMWAAQHPGWIPTQGFPTMTTSFRIVAVPIGGGALKGFNVSSIHYRDIDWQLMLHKRLDNNTLPVEKQTRPSWKIEPTVSEDYMKELRGDAYHERSRGPNRPPVIEFIKIGENHRRDCEKILLVGFEATRMTLFDAITSDVPPPPQMDAVNPLAVVPREDMPQRERERSETGKPDRNQPWTSRGR